LTTTTTVYWDYENDNFHYKKLAQSATGWLVSKEKGVVSCARKIVICISNALQRKIATIMF
jgi:hypothetical protein